MHRTVVSTLKQVLLTSLLTVKTTRGFVHSPVVSTYHTTRSAVVRSLTSLMSKPLAVIVQAEIQPDRLAEFLQLIETNAVETRKEPGCVRFDVVQAHDSDRTFFFYELYSSPDAIDYHKAQPHYALWANFKESGGVVASTTYKNDGLFLS